MAFSGICTTFKPLSTAGSINIVVDGKLQLREGMMKLVSSRSILRLLEHIKPLQINPIFSTLKNFTTKDEHHNVPDCITEIYSKCSNEFLYH